MEISKAFPVEDLSNFAGGGKLFLVFETAAQSGV
jgi:hypothetical protein